MPPKATRTEKWGQANRDLLEDLTNRQLIDITDTTYQNIEQVRDLHFRHRDKKNFRKNFRNYSAAWDLEIEYSGARCNRGKMRHLILLIFLPARVL
jgi:outer membrane cobalamin receptor